MSPAVVLLPGYGGAVTQPLLLRLEQALAPTVCLRLALPTHPRDDALAAQVAVLRAAIGRRRVVLVGRSFGARVAVRYANRYGARAVVALSYPLRGAARRPADEEEVRALTAPSLFIVGDTDPQSPLALLDKTLSPAAKVCVLKGAGHSYGRRTAEALAHACRFVASHARQ